MAMRILTSSEREAINKAQQEFIDNTHGEFNLHTHRVIVAGFAAGQDYNADQIAALQTQLRAESAERDALKLQADGLKQHAAQSLIKYADAAAECEGLRAERDVLRDVLREALQQIAAGNPPENIGEWLSDVEMADIARKALGNQT